MEKSTDRDGDDLIFQNVSHLSTIRGWYILSLDFMVNEMKKTIIEELEIDDITNVRGPVQTWKAELSVKNLDSGEKITVDVTSSMAKMYKIRKVLERYWGDFIMSTKKEEQLKMICDILKSVQEGQ